MLHGTHRKIYYRKFRAEYCLFIRVWIDISMMSAHGARVPLLFNITLLLAKMIIAHSTWIYGDHQWHTNICR